MAMADESGSARRAITREEVATHNRQDDCWVILHDLVLHLDDEYFNDHPGGPDVVAQFAGQDITQDYEDMAHSDGSRKWASKYIIGYVAGAPEAANTKMVPLVGEGQKSSSCRPCAYFGKVVLVLVFGFLVLAPVVALWHANHGGGETGSSTSPPEPVTNTTDIFSEVLQPNHKQPFWLQPAASGFSVMITFMIFGFDLSFQEAQEPSTGFYGQAKNLGKKVAKNIMSVVFIGLALNAYYNDVQLIVTPDVSLWVRLLLILVVIMTSSNYTKCLAIWGSLIIQSPRAALRVKPKYAHIGPIGFPRFPGQASWLPIPKHVYALVLLPYGIMRTICYMAMSFLWFVPGLCKGGCLFTLCSCKAMLCLIPALLICIFTLGSVMREELVWDWNFLLLLIYPSLMQLLCKLAPFVLSTMYGLATGSSMGDILKGFLASGGLCSTAFTIFPNAVNLEACDRMRLRKINKARLEVDFNMDEEEDFTQSMCEWVMGSSSLGGLYESYAHGVDITKEPLLSIAQNWDGEITDALDDARVAIVFATLAALTPIMAEQLLTTWIVRILCGNSFGEYTEAVRRTVSERHFSTYFGFLEAQGAEGFGKVSAVVNQWWNLL